MPFQVINDHCFNWLKQREENSIHSKKGKKVFSSDILLQLINDSEEYIRKVSVN